VIAVQGGIETLPAPVADQLRDGGRIAAVFMEGPLGTAQVGVKSGGQITWRPVFNATAPLLPGFARARSFAL
jgi:protein-L-isoaspartate(D-aspartate) O-methyltransferase